MYVSNTVDMGVTGKFTSFFLLTAFINLCIFFRFLKVVKNTILEFFFCYLSKWEHKNYI